ncbi:MAG: GNAT family N-acetyltransferase [Alphaproteobacteria bacterium]|nr:GNAT family N-acetyltransferase [Alphaproteobacteria bacterium]
MMKNLKVVNLADYPQYIEEVSTLVWKEWNEQNGIPLSEIIYRTKNCIRKDRAAQTWILLDGDTLVGTTSIWNNDLNGRQDLTPWIACLYIKPEYRRTKLVWKHMTDLQTTIMSAIKKLGYDKAYCITDHIGLYEKLGWEFLEMAPLKGKTTRVYEFSI